MKPTTTATVRTGWNTGLLVAAVSLVNRAAGWDLEVDDLLPLAPVAAVGAGVFYRASRVVADTWPKLGYVLFGSAKTPTYKS